MDSRGSFQASRTRGAIRLVFAALVAALLFGTVFAGGAAAVGASPPLDVYRNQIIVTPAAATDAREMDAVLTLQGLKKLSVSQITRDVLVEVPLGVDAVSKALALSAQPAIKKAEPNWAAKGAAVNDEYYSKQYAMAKIDAAGAWSQSTGAGVTVAVLDSGVQGSHPDFAGRVLAGWDFVNNDANAEDDQGHGTHVAGIAAATMGNSIGVAGVAPAASILPVKVLDAGNSGGWFQLAEGVYYATSQGARVVNMSIQGTGYSDALADALVYARSRGVVLVACAGNYSTDMRYYPGSYPGVIAVSATDSRDRLATYSNFGSWVDISAPGTDIYSTTDNGAYGFMSGTSMASPAVAGAAAVVLAKYPTLQPEQVETALTAGAVDLGATGKDPLYGAGRLSVPGALAAAAGATTTGSGSVTGKVSGATVGLSSVQVTVYRCVGGVFEPTASTISVAGGTYLLSNLRSGTYVVGFRDSLSTWAPAHYAATGPVTEPSAATVVTVTNGATTTNINLDLVKAGSLGGTVRKTGGVAVGGAKVELGYTGGYGDFKSIATTQAASNGTYRFFGLGAGYYYVRASDPTGTLLPALHADADGPAQAQVSVGGGTNSVDMTMTVGGVLTGKVTTSGGGALVSMLVYVSGETVDEYGDLTTLMVRAVRTSATGAYTASGLPAGSYDVAVSDPAGAYESSAAVGAMHVSNGATSSVPDIKLRMGGHVRGRVVDTSGTPVPGVKVSGWVNTGSDSLPAGVGTFTAADGSYDLGGVPPGSVEIDFRDLTEKYDASSKTLVISAGQTVTGVDATLTVVPRLSGRVVDSSGQPIGGIRVKLGPNDYCGPDAESFAFTAADGTYSLAARFVVSERIRMVLDFSDPANRYFTQYDPGVFDEGKATGWAPWGSADKANINATMTTAATITGIVRDGSGTPRANIEVRTGDGFGAPKGLTDSSGRYTIGGVDYGEYAINFADAAGLLDTKTAFVNVSDPTTPTVLDVTMTGSGSISGKVLDNLGRPRKWANPHWGVDDGNGGIEDLGMAVTDELGRYTIKSLPAGEYYVWYVDDTGLYADQYWNGVVGPDTATLVTVSSGTAVKNINFNLVALGGVSGRITDTSAAALPGMLVEVGQYDSLNDKFVVTGSTYTDASGTYRFRVPDGSWIVHASDPTGGHQDRYYTAATTPGAATNLVVAMPTVRTGINLSIPARASVSGTVTAGPGLPLGGVAVEVYSTADSSTAVGSAVTSADGSYTAYVDGPDTFKVRFDGADTGYDARYYTAATTWAAASTVSVTSQGQKKTGISSVLPVLSTISGMVRTPDGQPFASSDSRVWLSLTDAATGDEIWWGYASGTGAYSVHVPNGSYKIIAQDEYGEYRPRYYPSAMTSSSATTITISSVTNRAGTDITVGEPSWIKGKVTTGGFAVGGVTAEILNLDGSTAAQSWTGPDGSYAASLDAGTYRVRFVDSNRFSNQYYNGVTTEGAATLITVGEGEHRTGVNASLTSVSPQVVNGKVIDENGLPLGGIGVSTDSWQWWDVGDYDTGGYSSITKADGTFRIVLDEYATDCSLYLCDLTNGDTYDVPSPITVPTTGAGVTVAWDRTGTGGGNGDVTPPVTTASPVPAGWTKGPVDVRLTASDAGSGVSDTYFSVNGRPEHSYVTTVTFTVEGTTTMSFHSVDFEGNAEDRKSTQFRIDHTPPVTLAGVSAMYAVNSGRSVTLTRSDSLSGVASTMWRLGTSGAFTAGTTLAIPSAAGNYTLQYYSTDVAGNVETTHSVSFVVQSGDLVPPTTTATPQPSNAFSSWVSGDVTITLSAADASSSIAWTRYAVGGAAEQNYAGVPVVISASGVTTFKYRSQDGSGNAETTSTATVRIDKVAPSTSVPTILTSYESGGGTSVALVPSDVHSGVSATYWRIGTSGGFNTGTSAAVPYEVGSYTLEYYSVDNAGNIETPAKSVSFDVTLAPDRTAPITNATPLPANAFGAWVSRDVSITLSAFDASSSIAWTRYAVGGAAEQNYVDTPVVISAEGSTAFKYRSQDGLGNAEATKTATVRIDRTAPLTGLSNLQPAYTAGTGASIMLAATDSLSGVAATYWRIGGAYVAGASAPVPAAAGSYTLDYYSVDAAGNTEGVKSASFSVVIPPAVPASVGTPGVTGKATAKKGTALKGIVAPARSTGVTIEVQVLYKKKYKKYKKYAVVSAVGGTWKYKAKLKRGTYRVRALTAVDASYLAGVSGWRKVVVK